MKSNYLKVLLGTLIMFFLYTIYRLITGTEVSFNTSGVLLGLFSSLLIVILLSYYIFHSSFKGIKLVFAVFIIHYVIGCFNILIESYIFNVTNRVQTLQEMLQGFFVSVFFAPIFVWLLGKWNDESAKLKFEKRAVFSWIWRSALGIFLYLIFYLGAGMVLQMSYPELMDFYSDKIPPFDVMILTQFPRGLLFVIIAILILRSLKLSNLKKAVLIGLIFSILGGIAPLIPPNDLMPSNIRFVHGIEVGISNFLYGFIISFLLGQKKNKTMNEIQG
ncbi:hypothetical protein BX611_1061 [Lutibacter oceani]|uniref:Uncharacterized protein n=1 Tax=Lutibacter oceani TaxID=1853311 RepID=A0A3D9S376_9FLAO|nr:hypothetical protein [Lutibacter oceani]REE83766.1 hypothetical protein BX611_1061 [Lutibacter oceani]